MFHSVDLLVDELGLGQQRVGCCVVFFEFGRQSFGVGQYLLYGDGHCTEAGRQSPASFDVIRKFRRYRINIVFVVLGGRLRDDETCVQQLLEMPLTTMSALHEAHDGDHNHEPTIMIYDYI